MFRGRALAEWCAHFEFTRTNTAPTILPQKIEDFRDAPPVSARDSAVVKWTSGYRRGA
jgi:hypothetical protein